MSNKELSFVVYVVAFNFTTTMKLLWTFLFCPRISRIYTNFPVLFINGDLLGRTNFHECTHIISAIYMNVCARREQKPSLLGLCRAAANFRASECRAELVRAMPSAAENVKKTSVENERLCKARAEAKFTWIMPSRRQRCIYMKRLHTFPYTQFFPRKTRHTRH